MSFLAKKDNAKGTITNNPLTSGGLSITLQTGEGAKFPASGQFMVTLWNNQAYSDPSDDSQMEKILIDSVSGDTLTVNSSGRGYDGTTAVEHASGSRIALLITKKHFDEYETVLTALENNVDWKTIASAAYSSSDGPTQVITVPAGASSIYSPGMRLKYTQSQALTSYWTLDSSSSDSVGSNNGTDTNITYSAGKFGNAATFNGTSSKIVLADSASLKPTGEFTIGCWVKIANASDYRCIFQSASNNTNQAGIILQTVQTTGVANILIADNTSSTGNNNYSGKTNVCDNAWHYIVASYRNNYVQLYVDGKLESGGYSRTPSYAATNYVRFGVYSNSGTDTQFWSGQIDDLFLINGYALDEATIKAKYAAGTAQGTSAITVQKYALITAVADTALTVYSGTDYSVQNATISSPYYSTVASPFGFPKNPAKWMVEHNSTAIDGKSSGIVQNTWYNTGSHSLDVPIGNWRILLQANVQVGGVSGNCDLQIALSTSTSSLSDIDLSCWTGVYGTGAFWTISKEKIISTTSKTTYNIILRQTLGLTNAWNLRGDYGSTIIRAVSAYL